MALKPDPYMLRRNHPAVKEYGYVKTSEKDAGYNCIAWAAGESRRNWWPLVIPQPGCYWPGGVPNQDESVATFVAAFATLGYERCDNSSLEVGFEKVAIYAVGRNVTHMARQLESGEWSSKWGMGIDLTHVLEALADHPKHGPSSYGEVVQLLRRPVEPR